jgi:hypothetical protein
MPIPFSFHGTLNIHREADSPSVGQFVDSLASAVSAAGGKVLQRTTQTIAFQGVHRFDRTPLQTIRWGKVEVREQGTVIEIKYSVEIDRLRTIVPACIVLVLVILILAGVKGLVTFAVLVGASMLAVVAYAFVTRHYFTRWLRGVVEAED